MCARWPSHLNPLKDELEASIYKKMANWGLDPKFEKAARSIDMPMFASA